MVSKIKGIIGTKVKQSPSLKKLYLKASNGVWGKGYKKKIKGGENQLIFDKSSFFNNCSIHIIGYNNKVNIASGTIFNNVKIYIKGSNNTVNIASKVQFNHGGDIWVEDEDCILEIGEKTTFENAHLAVTEPNSKLTIGVDCMFANYIDVRTGDSHSILDNTTGKRLNPAKNVSIGNHVWIAAHVSILKGSSIADNSVIATRSVVTKEFNQKNILLAGTPAKKIKEDINWDRARL